MKWSGGFYNGENITPYQGPAQGALILRDLIAGRHPLMVARWGLFELRAVASVFFGYKNPYVLFDLCRNAGFFPAREECLPKFAAIYVDAAREMDIFAAWNFRHGHWLHESAIFKQCCPHAQLTDNHALDFLRPGVIPWTSGLAGRRVLIVHPFSELIDSQYHRRNELFMGRDVLPEFEALTTLKAVQSSGGMKTEYASWFDALENMKQQMEKIEFDIAIIGAGAYGLPLAAHAKLIGRQGIHLGGITQLLFGIMGKRWENKYGHFINPQWVYPRQEDRPPEFDKIEGGCYW
jgi:hypothetical protein